MNALNYHLAIKKYGIDIFSSMVSDGSIINKFIETFNDKKCLVIRTKTTGEWINKIELKDCIKISYDTVFEHEEEGYFTYKKTSSKSFNEFVLEKTKNNKFDLICIDPFHEFKESYRDLNIGLSLLSDDGILFCHDCSPKTFDMASSSYINGGWCGVTYQAFIKIANENPKYNYTLIDNDTGIGIISKKPHPYVISNSSINLEVQKIFLKLFEDGDQESSFNYFKKHGKELINMVSA